MANLKTKVGLEIHVQLKTKSKMFCGCDNEAHGKEPNTVVCPVCLAMPGSLPVANRQAIEWTYKTGLALNCRIADVAKFDRKHYFYPDLPKGYQISQYDEPFCIGGELEIDGEKVRLNRIHLEEDAGKLIHRDGKSLVDLNRAGTPLMEMVTEPDITSPAQAADFLRKLQKIVRDVVEVSEASMERGHMRCDANISVSDESGFMSPIIELKNLNSFKFVEKALTLVEEKLKAEYPDWPKKNSKETWGYDSVANKVYLQRRKEEAADYRYFPEPDLPPISSLEFDLDKLRNEINQDEDAKIMELTDMGVIENFAKVIIGKKNKAKAFDQISAAVSKQYANTLARVIANNEFGFELTDEDLDELSKYAKLIQLLQDKSLHKNLFQELASKIRNDHISIGEIEKLTNTKPTLDLETIIDQILDNNSAEVERYRAGDKKLIGFFIGQIMKEARGGANPREINEILNKKLEG